MIAYHASNKKFDKLSMDYANTREHKEQFNALWFSTDKDYVQQFGKYLYKVNIKGNFIKEEQFDLAEKLSNEFCKINNIKGYEDYGMMLETEHGQAFADFLVEKGYDGYIFPQHKGKTIIVFNPDCCKILGTLKEELTLSADDFEDFVIGGEEYNKEDYNDKYSESYGILLDGKLVGNIALNFGVSHNHAEIAGIEITDKRHGIGKQVIDLLKSKYKSLWVKATPDAKGFWSKMGFKQTEYNKDNGLYYMKYEKLNEEEYKYIDNTEILKLSPNDDLKVYRNFAKDFETLRALIVGEDIYLWDAKQLTHDQMADEIFGEDYEIYNQFMFDTRYKQLDDYSVRNTIDMVEFDKGTELAKQWYNDFFKYYKIIKDRLGVDFSKEGLEKVEQLKSMNPNRITERLEELEQGIYATQSAYDILNWLKNKPAPYRVVYDKNIRMYFICNAYDYIHQDMLEAAYRSGFYPEMYSVGDVQDYIYDTIDNEELLFFAFSPDADKVLDKEKSSDGYTQKYTYDFGAIYAHETTPLEDFDFYQLVGKPIKKDFIYEDFKSLNEKLQEFLS